MFYMCVFCLGLCLKVFYSDPEPSGSNNISHAVLPPALVCTENCCPTVKEKHKNLLCREHSSCLILSVPKVSYFTPPTYSKLYSTIL